MKLIFMGTPEFAVPALEALVKAGHEVVAVYTQPPRPAGRGMQERPSPVQQCAEMHHIPVETPTTLKTPETQQRFRDYRADVAVVAAYGLLLPQAILDACPHGCLNIHPSLLPRWRGAAPIQRQIMAGDQETGVTIMQMNAGLDTGDMLSVIRFPMPEECTAGELHDQLAQEGAILLLQTLTELEAGTLNPTPQDDVQATYAKKISKEEAHIAWDQPAAVVHAHIRGLTPYPGAFFLWNGERVRILRSSIEDTPHSAAPGTVLDDRLCIACLEGSLRPLILQRQGKKAMEVDAFLRGCTIPAGSVME
ncbi:MAG: methionyl-tRNA formyltransferase [Hyphomicrobiales bacterium]|nr:methionyl-tRNA formyltransferase [Hyphomicrobiales bacterium]